MHEKQRKKEEEDSFFDYHALSSKHFLAIHNMRKGGGSDLSSLTNTTCMQGSFISRKGAGATNIIEKFLSSPSFNGMVIQGLFMFLIRKNLDLSLFRFFL